MSERLGAPQTVIRATARAGDFREHTRRGEAIEGAYEMEFALPDDPMLWISIVPSDLSTTAQIAFAVFSLDGQQLAAATAQGPFPDGPPGRAFQRGKFSKHERLLLRVSVDRDLSVRPEIHAP